MSKIFHSLIFRFIIVTLVFFAATSPIIVLFGPFGNLKRAVVGAIMRSRHPQYITWLYNQDELLPAALQRRIMRLLQLTAGDFMIPMVREPAACPMGLSFMKESICSGSR